jgi:uncharacterized membrane protein
VPGESNAMPLRDGNAPPDQQQKMDLLLGYLLLGGVGLSMTLIVVGLIWRFSRIGHFTLDHALSGMNLFEFLLTEIRTAASGQMSPRTLIDGGIAVLMLTPFLRVAASVVYFMVGLKNWKYTLFTGFVLAVLTFSLFIR